MKWITPIFLFTVATCWGCHWFESVDDLHDCPLNSQFPCPCTTSCENGHTCLQKQGNHGMYGQCTLPCNGADQVCQLASGGFGVGGAGGQCMANGYCAVGCIFEEDCPAGMICASGGSSAASICVPGGDLDDGVFDAGSDSSLSDSGSDSETHTQDTDTVGGDDTETTTSPSFEQRQRDCQAYIDAAFFCNSEQEQTKSEVRSACEQDNWYAIDDCYFCAINNQCPSFAPTGGNCDSAVATEICCQDWVDCYLNCAACNTF